MLSYKTSGIVIKGTNLGEADRILTIMTERFGKIKVMAKGIRKIKSHLAGSLEPFTLTGLQLHEGRNFYLVTGAVIEKEFRNIHSDLKKTSQAFYVGELIDKFCEENQKNGAVFKLLCQILTIIDEEGCDKYERPFDIVTALGSNNLINLMLRAFEIKLIESEGFKPELTNCVHCKNKIEAGGSFWDDTEGGLICPACQKIYHHGKEISDSAIKLLRFAETNDFAKMKLARIDQKVREEAEKILSLYIRNILERELKSEKFLRQINS